MIRIKKYESVRKQVLVNILILLMVFLYGNTVSQNPIFDLPEDSVKVQQLFDLAWELEISNPDSAIALYEMGAEISRKIGYTIGVGRGVMYNGIVLSDQGKFDESIILYNKAIYIFEEIPYIAGIASTLVNIGNIYQLKAEYPKSIQNYLEGIKLFEEIQDSARLLYAYTNLGGIFSDVEQFEKSLSYYEKSLTFSRQLNDQLNICDCLLNIGILEFKQNNLQNAESYFLQALEIANEINEPYEHYLIYNSLSDIDTKFAKHEDALKKSKLSLHYASILGNPNLLSNAQTRLGMNYTNLNQLDSADYYLNSGIRLAQQNQSNEVLISGYQWMAELQEKRENYKLANSWLKRYKALQDSSSGQQQQRIISGLEIEYETEKKDLELSEKTLEIERNEALLAKRNYFIVALSGALISAFFFLFLLRRSLRQKKIIAEKNAALQSEKVEQLKKEQQVMALKSMMDGEEKERSRMARDLHDGLGGLLSSAKLHFSNIQTENTDLKQSEDFRKALELLDNTSSEARKIAHNLMPEALVKFGLLDALRDFCNNISESNSLVIDFQSYKLKKRLPESMEIMVYRIVQELMNNIVKHAKATDAIVQLMQNEQILFLTVEDNGIGFDNNKVEKDGAGMGNIKSRVDFLNGTFEIDSKQNEGTAININIPIG